ncbi:hypothetical protein SAMN02746089_02093 [Caldanaerobius fijiensis DSM 17918]|uniref:Uncharacterized protein n=1 Tax=Caldanaerobius fijiensis DSM 17918 TaxID=1121256 RepID=A0A1M5CCQ1_9THEO|nr:hypothetical protein [Caldanaerobius fijiensis]SHF52518.1 hypothetical protein SAMN02746089_02093 [Caldanaerobius fijiensis DSM 17918]
MQRKRMNIEGEILKKFVEMAHKYGYNVFKGQGKDNRIIIDGNTYFQFGDLRVDTETYHIVIEAESAGGVTNLVKYWYCLEKNLDIIKKPIVLFHVFHQSSEADYGSHLSLWRFLRDKMQTAVGDKIKAACYTYKNYEDIEAIVNDFEKYLV